VAKPLPYGSDGLTERERLIVEHLAAGCTIAETAEKVGVCPKTVYNYRIQKHIQQAVYTRQAELFDASGGHGLSILPDIVGMLTTIAKDTTARAADRIAAGKTLMTAANEYQARRQLLRQITELEERLYGVDEAAQQADAVDAVAEPAVDTEVLAPRRAARRRSE
jgi:transposase-like protein